MTTLTEAAAGSDRSGRRPVAGAIWLSRGLKLLLLLVPALYLATMARSPILGDPTEYTFVANILGIAHPPGYAFITLLGKLVQTLVPVGSIPWRMHLLSLLAATAAALFVYGTVRAVSNATWQAGGRPYAVDGGLLAALFAALTVATAANQWQHAIHANPHVITATFLVANLFLLTRWWAGSRQAAAAEGESERHRRPAERWLYLFCLSAGLGLTHHPLTLFAFPGYGLFILLVRPSIWRDWRLLLKMAGFALLGLSLLLYYPIRSPMEPAFGPNNMGTLDGFLDYVLARGLRVNLFHFGAADQPDRALVFWSLLRLQYSLPVIFLALLGPAWLLSKRVTTLGGAPGQAPASSPRHLVLLYGLCFLTTYAFVINSVQDVMAYLAGLFLVVGLLAGIGLSGLLALAQARLALGRGFSLLIVATLFLLGPGLQILRNAPYISLSTYDEGQAYLDAVSERFEGQGEGAVLLNDWEHMTLLWYRRYVEKEWPDAADVRPEFVSTQRPWLPSVFDYLPGGPVYLSNYRPEIVEAGFRLRPDGLFYRVVEPGETSVPAGLTPAPAGHEAAAGEVELVAYRLPQRSVTAGDFVPLTLAMRAPAGVADYYVPEVQVGDMLFTFTTDSHLVTPDWRPGEVIVERFDFALPHDLEAGGYPVVARWRNLSDDTLGNAEVELGHLLVSARPFFIPTDDLLANFRQRVGLAQATARVRGQLRRAPWEEPLRVQPGDVIALNLQWRSLAPAEESYTVFVHLIDLANKPLVALDYTPLGGATPTHLWFPKWLPGQQMADPYRVPIPTDLEPGLYHIEAGLYEMVSGRRLHLSDAAGNLAGDRTILGSVVVEAPASE